MRKIVFNHLKDGDVPIPYFKGGEVHTDLLNFLLCRYHHPRLFETNPTDRNLKSVTQTTMKNIGHHVAYLINIFEENEDEHGKSDPIDYREATFDDHVSPIITSLYEDYEWTGESLKVYVGSWRLFYEFLTLENVNHNMMFPARISIKQTTDKDDDFVSHTRENIEEVQLETAVPDRYCTKRDDYRDSVISMEQWFKLYKNLYVQDPVYAVMAATMLQTFLRIGGVMQFPIGITRRNKQWKRYAQMKQSDQQYQKFNYIKKGQTPASCLVHTSTMKMIFEEYLEPFYGEREELYKKKYMTTKHAIKQNRDENSKFTWLNKNGTPVSMRELQQAFQDASKDLGFEVTPHTLRHTGATQLLYRWGKEKGIEITEANTNDIHSWLKYQLGHNRLKTTRYYVRTVYRLQTESVISEILSTTLPIYMEGSNINPEAVKAFERAKEAQDVFMTGRIKDENFENVA